MKKVLFLMAFPIDYTINLKNKFIGQMEAVENLGYEVWVTATKKDKIFLCSKNERIMVGKIPLIKQNIVRCHYIFKIIPKILSIIKFDFCYIRTVPPIFSYIKALKNIKQTNAKVIVEIPTFPKECEQKNSEKKIFNKGISFFEKINGKKESLYVDLYTIIGEQTKTYKNKPSINIENCVSLKNMPARKYKGRSNEVCILALANMAYWHGYDRIIESMHQYLLKYGSFPISVILYMIGTDGDGSLKKWKELVKKYHLEKHIKFEGMKSGEELNKYFEICDIGLASIGGFRKKSTVTSELKIREYMARGLPFIYATNDRAINEGKKYCMKVNDDNSMISFDCVLRFALNCKKNAIQYTRQMREEAENNMLWEAQFEKVFENLDYRK